MPVWKKVESPTTPTIFLFVAELLHYLRRAVGHGEAGAHAQGEVLGVQRRVAGEGVAADVAYGDDVLDLAQLVEEADVRAAGAEHGRAAGDDALVVVEGLGVTSPVRALRTMSGFSSPSDGDERLADALDAGGAQLVLHVGLELLDDVELLDLGLAKFRMLSTGRGLVMPHL